jgi:hypothetical protein
MAFEHSKRIFSAVAMGWVYVNCVSMVLKFSWQCIKLFEKSEFITSHVIHFRALHESEKSFVSLFDKLFCLDTLRSVAILLVKL